MLVGTFFNNKVTNCCPNKNPVDDHILQREKRKKTHTEEKKILKKNFKN
jgi:hypothetical protein